MLKIAVSLSPVFVFLVALLFIDSYKLVKVRAVLAAILAGALAALICFFINSALIFAFGFDRLFYVRYFAPLVEELAKAVYLVWLLRSHKIGFMVDSAICGFAIGAGFAFVENVYYLQALNNSQIAVWFIRGFGTAVMHGGTTAILGIVAKEMLDRRPESFWRPCALGLTMAILLHAIYNQFVLPPLLSTLTLLILFPAIILFIFERSEKAARAWLGLGFDADVELLEIITNGGISETKIGKYLDGIKSSFPGELVADMLCLVRIHLELAVRAKGILMLRKTGFSPQPDPEIRDKFDELRYLEKSLGKTGLLAVNPLIQTSSRDLWQIYMLDKS